MKELSRKVFLTVLGMLSLFLTLSVVLVNVVGYRREYEGVRRNLGLMNDHGMGPRDEMPGPAPAFDDFENMRIMDYDVYTVELSSSGTVTRIFSLGNEESTFDAEAAADEILRKYSKDTLMVENLYAGKYSFNYKMDNSIIIINDASIAKKLRTLLVESLAIFIVIELLLIFISRLLTGWITKPAKEALERQKEFIADASHELKTPLAVIMASSDELVADESSGKYIENIKYESDRMNRLISGLLDLSKLEEDASKESYKEENLSKIVEKTALVFEAVAFEQGITIKTDIEDGITFNCSKDEIEKLVSTLLDNAIKHSDKDTAVSIRLSKSKSLVNIQITNKGEPIAQGDEEKIFERFYRADKSRSRSENRYGLGLAIAKRIVINHGGSIKASSDGKMGTTTFEVTFKLTA
ncbi:MAG: HAMP domain-containing sensor histidine kinase [Eubacterium sp.]|nr:HAMP domain-containing sensor histidine kinase [Eubacterium sp.]